MSNKLARKKKTKIHLVEEAAAPLKLDLGCGPNKQPGFIGVDRLQFDGKVDKVCDLRVAWPWKDDSVDEVYCSHFIEHLDADERIHFVNELWRVLKVNAKATIVAPHFCSCRAYGDLTHQWPPVSEFWFFYLDEAWRAVNAPHNDFYRCNFSGGAVFTMHPALTVKNQEYQNYACTFYKEAAQDIVASIMKVPRKSSTA